MNRLVLARHLYQLAVQSLAIPNDVGLHSYVHLTQDAVEAFLIALADHVNASIPEKAEFDKYITQINAKIHPKELPFRTKLLRLNRLRVGSKHHGILPPRGECDALAITVRDFFEQVSTEHLGVNFQTATPIDLLTEGEAKILLAQAMCDRDEGRLEDCIINCRKALYLEVERDYDISAFRANAPKPGFLMLGGHASMAPFYARTQQYIQENVRKATDFIVFDRGVLERSLLSQGVDPTMFWNVLRLTPAVWQCKVTRKWFVQREFALLTQEALLDSADYVLSSAMEMALSIHTKKRSVRNRSHGSFSVTLSRDGVPVFKSADQNSEVVAYTATGCTTLSAAFDIEGIEDGLRYYNVSPMSLLEGWYSGFVLHSDLTFDP